MAQSWQGDSETNAFLGLGYYWSDPLNWNNGLPANTDAVTFGIPVNNPAGLNMPFWDKGRKGDQQIFTGA